jgi:hypothetical protein
MQAQELFLSTGKSAGVYYCTKCKLVRKTQAEAEDCCSPYKCQQCGTETERYYTICNSCLRKKEHAEELARFEKSEKLTSFCGWIFHNDRFYESIGDMLNDIDDDLDIPEYVWATTECHFVQLDICNVSELACNTDSAYEDFDSSDLDGIDELKIAIDEFNKANYSHISYLVDYTKAVLVGSKSC